ncbi:uncharacterized protein LOC142767679 isoform X1 [Rhipicephalus microplus]|uniref:uncharacterized protein LOC142767679 isoform X1 n=1 Tax=Rhipicephalus microplus TaxID=6941 RepID=UPI003F6D1F58
MVESLDMRSTLLHQLLGVFTESLQMCWVNKASRFQHKEKYNMAAPLVRALHLKLTLSRKRGAAAAPRKEQAPSKLPKLSSTGTARSLCGIENHCKECLISTLCCSFIAEDEVDHSRGTSRCVLCL